MIPFFVTVWLGHWCFYLLNGLRISALEIDIISGRDGQSPGRGRGRWLSGFDVDPPGLGFFGFEFGDLDVEDSVFEGGLDVVGIDF